jgi:hypothetical protein
MNTRNAEALSHDEPAAVRVRDLDQYFPGISHSYKYKHLIPRLERFHLGRVQWATLSSIHRLIAQQVAEKNPQAKRRGRPRKVQAVAQAEGASA